MAGRRISDWRMPVKHSPFLVLLSLAAASLSAAEYRVIGYYMSWTQDAYPPSRIPFEHLTHVAHAFAWPEADGTLKTYNNFPSPDLIRLAHANGVAVILSVGGWGNSGGFAPMAASPASRARFITAVVSYCRAWGYDGVDLDWEYPKKEDRENLARLFAELRAALNREKIRYLSAAVPAHDWAGGYDSETVRKHLDWVGLMTYDFSGSWNDRSGHNAPLFPSGDTPNGALVQGLRRWTEEKDIPTSQVCIGLPFYGRLFYSPGLNRESTGGDMVTYAESLKMTEGWTANWDKDACVPWFQDPEQKRFLSLDDPRSIEAKCNLVREEKLGGVIIWALGQDDCGTSQPLLQKVGSLLRPGL